MSSEILTIPKAPQLDHSEDYSFLRKEGLKFIERLSGKIWTDYNTHDPGITIFELLCYAITDLGYRSSHPMEDLLASSKGTVAQFLNASQVLPVNPTTEFDIRKLAMDVDGIRNAWITTAADWETPVYADLEKLRLTLEQRTDGGPDADHPHRLVPIKGLYNVLLEFEPRYDGKSDDDLDEREKEVQQEMYNKVREEVRRRLLAHRNLCEDLLGVSQVEYEDIAVCADIEVKQNAEIALTQAKIYQLLIEYFSPPITFYTLEEMLDKGKRIDEIFEGPLLRHGFLDDEELGKLDMRTKLYASDVINAIMDLEEVTAVKSLKLIKYVDGEVIGDPQDWEMGLLSFKAPRLSQKHSKFIFYKGVYPYMAHAEEVQTELLRLRQVKGRFRLQGHSQDMKPPQGRERELADYFPVQNDFPMVYGIGETGLSQYANDERKAQAKQLKAYLVLYEQLLTNYLAQLAGTGKLFSAEPTVDRHSLKRNANGRTYFTQPLREIRMFQDETILAKLFASSDADEREALRNELIDLFGYPALVQIEWMTETDESTRAPWRAKLAELYGEEYVVGLEEMRENEPGAFADTLQELKDNFSTHYQNDLNEMVENDHLFAERRNRFLDHLLARFCEEMTEYSLILHRHPEFRNDPDRTGLRVIADKELFLSDYHVFSGNRGKAYNYKPQNPFIEGTSDTGIWDTRNVTGLKHRIIRVLGMDDYRRRSIASGLLQIQTGKGVLPGETVERDVWWVVMHDPSSGDILLESINYPNRECAQDTLHYMLHRGDERSRYDIKKAGGDYIYRLLDGCPEPQPLGFSPQEFETLRECEAALDRLTRIFDDYCDLEDFHIVEHLLLRPRTSLHPLMNVCLTKPSTPLTPIARCQKPAYRFEIIDLTTLSTEQKKLFCSSPGEYDNYGFELVSNFAGGTEDPVIMRSQSYNTRQDCLNDIWELRSRGSNRFNYNRRCVDEPAPGEYRFGICDEERCYIAMSKDFANEEELNHALSSVISYFSFQGSLLIDCSTNMEMDTRCAEVEDPYSFRISVFLPAWPTRFRSMHFRQYMEKVIRQETPAHIYPKICWISYEQMMEFETHYKAWIETMANEDTPDPDVVKNLIDMMNRLNNMYPTAVLHDCADVSGDEPQVILGNTMLGSL